MSIDEDQIAIVHRLKRDTIQIDLFRRTQAIKNMPQELPDNYWWDYKRVMMQIYKILIINYFDVPRFICLRL